MNHDADVLTMVRRANPLPDLERFDPDEVAAGVAAIEAAWQAERQAPAAVPRPAPSRHRPLRYAIAFVAAAVLALVLIGGPILFRDRQEAPVIDEPTTTMPTTVTTAPVVTTTAAATTTTATTTTVPLPPMPAIAFHRDSEAEIPGFIEEMIQAEPGLIAVGVEMVCGVVDGEFVCNGDAGIWVSPDGGPWERAGDPALLFTGPDDKQVDGWEGWIYDVAAGPLGIVAVGEDSTDAAVWLSEDGIEWARVPTSEELGRNSKMFSVAFGGPGVVAAGTTGGLYAAVWVSDDAMTWTRVEDPSFAGDSEPAVIRSLTVSPSGLVALGSIGFQEGFDQAGTDRTVLWISPDGLKWERVPNDTLESIGVGEVESIQGGDAGFLMVGSLVEEDEVGMWTSVDGYAWERIEAPTVELSRDGSGIDYIGTQWDGSRWISVGLERSTGTVWAAFDLDAPLQPVGSLDTGTLSDSYEIGGLIVAEAGFVIVTTEDLGDETTRFTTWTGTWGE